jgi:hypothetical protein
MAPYNLQNGNILDLTWENNDICYSVIVLNGSDIGKKSHVLTSLIFTGKS